MKAIKTLPAQNKWGRNIVKYYLINGIIYLTSEKFTIFAGVIAAIMECIGIYIGNERFTAFGGLVFLIGFTPRAVRETAYYDVRRTPDQ